MAVEKYSFEVLFYVVFILIGQFASVLVTGPFSAYMMRPTRFLFSAHLHFHINMNWRTFCDEKLQIEGVVLKGVGHLLWTRNNKQLVVSSRSSNISKYRFICQKWKRKSKLIIRPLHTLYRKMNRTTCNRTRSTFFSDFSRVNFCLHRCWWWMLETKCGDNFGMLVTDLMRWINPQHNKKSHQHNDSVTNIWNLSPS